MSRVQLFTDGACRGNPGPGGWAFLLKHPASGTEKEVSGGDAATTNNRMELQAVIEGLRALKRPSEVEVITDSVYVCLLYTSPSPRDGLLSRMPSSA